MSRYGSKIEDLSLKSMINRAIFALMFLTGALYGAPPRESLAVQEMRLALEQVGYHLNSHKVEIDLLHDHIQNLEAALSDLRQRLSQANRDLSLEKRLASLEKAHEALISDFKSFKSHMNETSSALAKCQAKISQIDQQLSSDIKSLKGSLQSMLTLLQPSGEGKTYTVQLGDSLGQIAIDHKTDIKALKKLNNLASDTIYSGQKLLLP